LIDRLTIAVLLLISICCHSQQAPEKPNAKPLAEADTSRRTYDDYYLGTLRLSGSLYSEGAFLAPEFFLTVRIRKSRVFAGIKADYLVLHSLSPPYSRYVTARQQSWNVGFAMACQVRRRLYLTLSALKLTGKETFTQYFPPNISGVGYLVNTTVPLTGVGVELGVAWHEKATGALLGGEIFVRENNSKLLGSGAGIKLSVGFRL
jgi:hypothetical protein